ncbi:hypothetical protein [Butyrivibrio sp. AD3002]|uniref:hypothetical protein n=1 Tax=Butyrivibrio sp. AD3002 TaxID=1280670 RepID=UPI0003B437D3|nr:hypothetical protein [Butyrivibrio sp. AD3002]
MRTSKEILERISETYQYFKEAGDTEDERYNNEKNMWKDLFIKFYEGLENAEFSDLDAEHYTAAFRSVIEKRNEKLSEIFENRYSESQDKANSNVEDMEDVADIMQAGIETLKDTKNNMEYFGLANSVMRALMFLEDDVPLKAFVDIVKNYDEKDKDKEVELPDNIFSGHGEEYAYIKECACSRKGAALLEEKLGVLPEFNELFGR